MLVKEFLTGSSFSSKNLLNARIHETSILATANPLRFRLVRVFKIRTWVSLEPMALRELPLHSNADALAVFNAVDGEPVGVEASNNQTRKYKVYSLAYGVSQGHI